jgi:hypothetical protein
VSKKEINVYYAAGIHHELIGHDILYPNPTTLFNEYTKNRADHTDTANFLSCPAVANKFKKTLVFKCPATFSYSYDFDNDPLMKPVTENNISIFINRNPTLKDGPLMSLELSYILFADEPLDCYFTPPMFSKPGYTKEVSIIPGEFNIGKWFRPYNIEFQFWNKSGVLEFQENEHLFYAELKTDKKIKMHKFQMTPKLTDYVASNTRSTRFFGRGESLLKRYNRFTDAGMREKVLTEIKKNLIDE